MGNPGHAGGTVEDVPISPDQESALTVIVQGQAGVVSARQLSTIGVSLNTVRAQIGARRRTRLHAGIYSTFTGPQPDLARVWAAVLSAGEDAVASHQTAEWRWGLRADLPACLRVSVPHGQRRCSRPGVLIRQRRFLADRRHPARTPPLTTVEDTLLDLAEEARTERQVIDLLLRGCQQRRTTPSRLAAAAAARPRLRWRKLVRAVLTEARDGVATPLERRLRDNDVAERNEQTLRYGWRA